MEQGLRPTVEQLRLLLKKHPHQSMSLEGTVGGALRVESGNKAVRLKVGRVPMANGTIAAGIAPNPGLDPSFHGTGAA
jgi:hypothetical protein